MHSLSLGFCYITGLSWLLSEVCVSASHGNWTPLWLFLIFFVLMFSILGCLPLSNKAIDRAGPVFSILIGLGIIAYALAAFGSGFFDVTLRLFGGGFMIGLGLLGFAHPTEEEAH